MNLSKSLTTLLIVLGLIGPAYGDDPQIVTVKVTVDLAKAVGTVPELGIGLGVAVWDDHMTDKEVPALIRNAGVSIIRYPGGSYADIYHWKANAATPGTHATIRPQDDFEHFVKLLHATKTQALITVNYGSNVDGTGGGDPQEAADWVKYANVDHKYGIEYWEIGNEVYGNGEYGAKWEEDLHADKSPSEYGRNVNAFAKAMKAVDPSVKIGAVLTGPDSWPDGRPPAWNPAVLGECGKNIDFVVVHWYPDQGGQTNIFEASVANIPNIGTKARVLVDQYCRPGTPIWISEGDATGGTMQVQGALFAADLYPRIWENGIESFDWWDLHNGLDVSDEGRFSDQGILSNASCAKSICEPAVNTPFPPYYGIKLVHYFSTPGDTLVDVKSDAPSVIAHAVLKAGGKVVGLMLINKDPRKTAEVTVDAGSVSLGQADVRYSYGRNSKDIETSGGDGLVGTSARLGVVKLPPYSVTVLIAPELSSQVAE